MGMVWNVSNGQNSLEDSFQCSVLLNIEINIARSIEEAATQNSIGEGSKDNELEELGKLFEMESDAPKFQDSESEQMAEEYSMDKVETSTD